MLISGKMFSCSDISGVEDKRMRCFTENPTVLAVSLRQDLVPRFAAVVSDESQNLVAGAIVRSRPTLDVAGCGVFDFARIVAGWEGVRLHHQAATSPTLSTSLCWFLDYVLKLAHYLWKLTDVTYSIASNSMKAERTPAE